MPTQISLLDAIGKTLENFIPDYYHSQLLLKFTDGTVALIYTDYYEEGSRIALNEEFNYRDFSTDYLEKIFSKEEVDCMKEESRKRAEDEQAKIAAQKQEARFQEYLRLKAEFDKVQ